MLIKSQKDFFAGLMFAAIGVTFAVGATNYTVGTAARMGRGYFPMILGILLAVLGGGIVLGSILRRNGPPDGDPVGKWAWKPLFYILAANFAFGILLVGLPSLGIPSFGLIVAIFVLTVIASRAGYNASFKSSVVLGAVLAIGSYLVFIKSLNLVLPVWPSFIG
ncbi:tripartite tricarboxylate transporter TctB family protein [Lampropedia puyangensis]|uniref:Tripartite tricarboxylate transporter TctB family protein n=1 Tax=Lampropedia puyangensis TaxID=1330072 RepID=A0A4S8F2K5_9BURK|nr:tripartite tricarboxylate transporter TctB family protein [Lampropedia puyangensis]THU00635.1 tripartite tricarboxylate transporter TctB family protein [Lampropedia puyangensis]